MSRRTLWSCLAVLGIGAAVWLATNGDAPHVVEARKDNVTPSTFLQPPEADTPSGSGATLLLFIHGIFGDTVGTWSDGGNSNLPALILQRPAFSKGFDTFAFGFPSAKVKEGSFRVPEAAQALHTE